MDEADLSALAKSFLLWSEEARDASSKKPLPIEPVKAFFANQSDRLNVALQDAEGLPWKILHSAAVALDVSPAVVLASLKTLRPTFFFIICRALVSSCSSPKRSHRVCVHFRSPLPSLPSRY